MTRGLRGLALADVLRRCSASARVAGSRSEPRHPQPAARHERPRRPGPAARARPAVPHPARRAHRPVQADRRPAAGPAGRRRAGDRQRQHPRRARAARPAVRGQPGRRVRRRPRRHPDPDPGRGRRHHRPHRRRLRAADPAQGRAPTRSTRCCTRSTAPPRRPGSTGTACTGSPSAPRAPSTRRTGGCATPGTCPAGTTRTCSTGSPRRSACPLEVENDVNLAAIAEMRLGAGPRGRRTSSCCGRTKGLGAAIVIDGRVHGGATGGAGEVGFLPLPGTPLVRHVRRGNAGGFQELAGGRRCSPWPGRSGCAPSTPAGRRRQGADDTRGRRRAAGHARRALRARPRRPGRGARPALVVLAGGVLTAGGARLRDLIAERGRLAGADPAPPGAGRRHREPGAGRRPADRAGRHPRRGLRHHPTPHRTPARPGPSPGENHDQTHASAAAWRPPTVGARPAARGQRLHRLLRGRRRTTTRTRTSPSPSGTAGARDSEVAAIQADDRRLRGGQPQHPRQGRRQHHRRQDQPGAAGRRLQRARRRLVVHHRQRRPVLHLGCLRRPDAVHGEVRHRPGGDVPAGAAGVHAVRGQPVRAAAAERRLRPLLQQGRVRRGRHHRAAQDACRSSTPTP